MTAPTIAIQNSDPLKGTFTYQITIPQGNGTAYPLWVRSYTGPGAGSASPGTAGAWTLVGNFGTQNGAGLTISGQTLGFGDNTQIMCAYRSLDPSQAGANWSGWAAGSPAAATNLTAQLVAPAGASIQVSWTNNAYTNAQSGETPGVNPSTTIVVQRWNGSTWVGLATLADTATSYTDASPLGGTNQYRIQTTHTNADSSVYYRNSASVSVGAAVAPLAPTNLAPSGATVDATQPITLTWQHNPGADGAAQSHFTIQYSTNGGSTWNALATNVASTVSSYTVAANTFTQNTSIQWRVATEGLTTPGFGPYSAASTLTFHANPTVTLDPATPGATWTSAPLLTNWAYAEAQGDVISSWTAWLYDNAGNLLETQTNAAPNSLTPGCVSGTHCNGSYPNQIKWQYPIQSGSSYTVKMQVTSSTGQQSTVVSATTAISYAPTSGVNVVAATFNVCTGTVELDIAPIPATGSQVRVDHVVVQRRINNNVAPAPWVTIMANIALPASGTSSVAVVDTIPVTNGLNEYRLLEVALAASGGNTYYMSPVISVNGTDGQEVAGSQDGGHWVWLNYGPGFATALRMHGDPSIQRVQKREVTDNQILGKAFPVGTWGNQVSRVITISGSLAFQNDCATILPSDCTLDTAPEAYEAAALAAGMVLHRDFRGRRWFGSLNNLQSYDGLPMGNSHSIFPHRRNIASVQYVINQLDYNENVLSPDVSSSGLT